MLLRRLFERFPDKPPRAIMLDLLFEPRDLWFGLYWTRVEPQPTQGWMPGYRVWGTSGEWTGFDAYICLVPTLPLRLQYRVHRRYAARTQIRPSVSVKDAAHDVYAVSG